MADDEVVPETVEEVVAPPTGEVVAPPTEEAPPPSDPGIDRLKRETREARERAEALEEQNREIMARLDALTAKADPDAQAREDEAFLKSPTKYLSDRDSRAAQIRAREEDGARARADVNAAPEAKDPEFKDRMAEILQEKFPGDDKYLRVPAQVQIGVALELYRARFPKRAAGPKITRTPPGGGPTTPAAAGGGEGSGPPTAEEWAQVQADLTTGHNAQGYSKGHRTLDTWAKAGRIPKRPY